VLTASVLIFISSSKAQEEEEGGLHAFPYALSVEPGEEVTIECSHYPEDLDADAKLEWFLPNNDAYSIRELLANETAKQQNPGLDRFTSENGTLTFTNASLEDSGYYSCRDREKDLEYKVQVKVYVMPSYLTEAVIVIVINCVLVLIFIGCSLWTGYRDRRHKRLLRLGEIKSRQP